MPRACRRSYPNSLGQPTGEVLPGGTVSLLTQRGFIELLPGSMIDVSGTSGVVAETGVGGGAVRSEQVASAGGTVDLSAADGAEFGGTFEAAAGTPGPACRSRREAHSASRSMPVGATITRRAAVRRQPFPVPGRHEQSDYRERHAAAHRDRSGPSDSERHCRNRLCIGAGLGRGRFRHDRSQGGVAADLGDDPALPGRIDFVGNVTLGAARIDYAGRGRSTRLAQGRPPRSLRHTSNSAIPMSTFST